MKKLVVSLVFGINACLMYGQVAQTPPDIPAKEVVSPTPPTNVAKNGRNQLCHAGPYGDRLINRELRRHLRQEIRKERHLRRELRRLRRERSLHPPIR